MRKILSAILVAAGITLQHAAVASGLGLTPMGELAPAALPLPQAPSSERDADVVALPVEEPTRVPLADARAPAGDDSLPPVDAQPIVIEAGEHQVEQEVAITPVDLVRPAAAVSAETDAPLGYPAAIAPANRVWLVERGTTLREVVERWGVEAGWTVRWDTDLDYRIHADFQVEGTFLEAIEAVFAAYKNAPEKFSPSAWGNKVLHVVKM